MNCATNAILEPTASGGGVSHSTALMFWYHAVAFVRIQGEGRDVLARPV